MATASSVLNLRVNRVHIREFQAVTTSKSVQLFTRIIRLNAKFNKKQRKSGESTNFPAPCLVNKGSWEIKFRSIDSRSPPNSSGHNLCGAGRLQHPIQHPWPHPVYRNSSSNSRVKADGCEWGCGWRGT